MSATSHDTAAAPLAADWRPTEPTLDAITARHPRPFAALAAGETPALIVRNAFAPADCAAVLARIEERGVRKPSQSPVSFDWVGTSLGMLGNDPAAFFADAAETHALYETLFEGLADPVRFTFATLNALAVGHRAIVAQEADGRRYGPGIFRYYPPGRGHHPHFDSVRLREKRTTFGVYRYPHQFASILCLQAPDPDPDAGECIIHRCRWSEEVQPHIDARTFPEYAAERAIPSARIVLGVGDFYVFNTRCIHEVPPITGTRPRVVLATFLGFDPDEEEVQVWS